MLITYSLPYKAPPDSHELHYTLFRNSTHHGVQYLQNSPSRNIHPDKWINGSGIHVLRYIEGSLLFMFMIVISECVLSHSMHIQWGQPLIICSPERRIHLEESRILQRSGLSAGNRPVQSRPRHLRRLIKLVQNMEWEQSVHWSGLTITTAPFSGLIPRYSYTWPWPLL